VYPVVTVPIVGAVGLSVPEGVHELEQRALCTACTAGSPLTNRWGPPTINPNVTSAIASLVNLFTAPSVSPAGGDPIFAVRKDIISIPKGGAQVFGNWNGSDNVSWDNIGGKITSGISIAAAAASLIGAVGALLPTKHDLHRLRVQRKQFPSIQLGEQYHLHRPDLSGAGDRLALMERRITKLLKHLPVVPEESSDDDQCLEDIEEVTNRRLLCSSVCPAATMVSSLIPEKTPSAPAKVRTSFEKKNRE